jgi:tetratricopeptide (TPR) repeat protein
MQIHRGVVLALTCFVMFSFACAIAVASEDQKREDETSSGKAIAVEEESSPEGEPVDELLYRKGLRELKEETYGDALATFAQFEREHPESPLLEEARFAMAEAYASLNLYKEAERLVEGETARLTLAGRKEELAELLIALADTITAFEGWSTPGISEEEAHFGRSLYTSALGLGIPPERREHVLYTRAFAMFMTRREIMYTDKNWGPAIADIRAYLEEFGPEAEEGPGKHSDYARGLLAAALWWSSKRAEARAVWQALAEDLQAKIKELEKETGNEEEIRQLDAMRAEAMHMITGTQTVGDRESTLFCIDASYTFLAEYPRHQRAPVTSYTIGEHYKSIQLDDEAIRAFNDFLVLKHFQAESEEAREKVKRLVPYAIQNLAYLYRARGKDDLVDALREEFPENPPNRPYWLSEEMDRVLKEYRGSMRRQASRSREAYVLGESYFLKALTLKKQRGDADEEVRTLYGKAIETWDRLARDFPRAEEAPHALFMTGFVYENELDDVERAMEAYEKCTSGHYGELARERLKVIATRAE